MSHPVQTRENHTRFDPPFHFFIIPVLVLFLLVSLWQLGQTIFLIVRLNSTHTAYVNSRFELHALLGAIGQLLIASALLTLAFRVRIYALKVQDRVIRLEERLRMAALLPEDLRTRIPELRERQLIALRFASDSELSALVTRSLNENLSSKQIKESITHWRADHWRV